MAEECLVYAAAWRRRMAERVYDAYSDYQIEYEQLSLRALMNLLPCRESLQHRADGERDTYR